jgi:hypothetical protein
LEYLNYHTVRFFDKNEDKKGQAETPIENLLVQINLACTTNDVGLFKKLIQPLLGSESLKLQNEDLSILEELLLTIVTGESSDLFKNIISVVNLSYVTSRLNIQEGLISLFLSSGSGKPSTIFSSETGKK